MCSASKTFMFHGYFSIHVLTFLFFFHTG